MKLLKNIYANTVLFYVLSADVVVFAIGFEYPILFAVGQAILAMLIGLAFIDALLLFGTRNSIQAQRTVNKQLSLGDENPVTIRVVNRSGVNYQVRIVDEQPYQLQARKQDHHLSLAPGESKSVMYTIRPVKRGEYVFHNLNIYVSSFISLLRRRYEIDAEKSVAVYPSIMQMKKYEFQVFSKTATLQGIKKMRRIGQQNEFEQIKNYVQGDDYRTINWKATSRRNELMVNQYQEERAQQIYFFLDKSRNMRMPFDDMSLLDYAINSTLVMSNIALHKGDRAGVVTYSDKLGPRIAADRSADQLKKITELLYRQKTEFNESNFELLYYGIRHFIKGRSLVMLFTNLESIQAAERVLPLLRRINKTHLLVVVFFENNELEEAKNMQVANVKDIYRKTMAEKFSMEKRLIVRELRKYGIQTVLTRPEQLSVDTINKYLELKSRGFI